MKSIKNEAILRHSTMTSQESQSDNKLGTDKIFNQIYNDNLLKLDAQFNLEYEQLKCNDFTSSFAYIMIDLTLKHMQNVITCFTIDMQRVD